MTSEFKRVPRDRPLTEDERAADATLREQIRQEFPPLRPAIRESDWKLLRQLKSVALERFCQRVLTEVERIAGDAAQTNHERYLELYELMRRRDKELANAFDDLRRSTAIYKLACMVGHHLVTVDELSRFSPETREAVGALAALR